MLANDQVSVLSLLHDIRDKHGHTNLHFVKKTMAICNTGSNKIQSTPEPTSLPLPLFIHACNWLILVEAPTIAFASCLLISLRLSCCCPCSNNDIYFIIQLVRESKASNSPVSLEQQNTKCNPCTNHEAAPESKIKEWYPITFFSSSQATLLWCLTLAHAIVLKRMSTKTDVANVHRWILCIRVSSCTPDGILPVRSLYDNSK